MTQLEIAAAYVDTSGRFSIDLVDEPRFEDDGHGLPDKSTWRGRIPPGQDNKTMLAPKKMAGTGFRGTIVEFINQSGLHQRPGQIRAIHLTVTRKSKQLWEQGMTREMSCWKKR